MVTGIHENFCKEKKVVVCVSDVVVAGIHENYCKEKVVV